MPELDSKTIVRRFVEEIMVRRNLEVLEELVHPEYRREDRFTPEASREELRQNLLETKSAWQERKVEVEDLIAEADRVVVILKASGKLSGEYKGITPTHRAHSSRGIAIVTLQDGRIRHVSTHWDYLSLFEEVGYKMSSQADQNKLIVSRFITEAIVNRDIDTAREVVAENFVRNDALRPIHGRDALVEALEENAWSDSHLTIEAMVAEGDTVAVQLRGTGTHTGNFYGVPPSHHLASSSGIAFVKVQNGKITQVDSHWDHGDLLNQIGGSTRRTA
jgi:steroid delta-isomerase-like uncharacterized protein